MSDEQGVAAPGDGSSDDEIDLAALSDDDLVLQMHDDLYDGLKEEIAEGTTILLDRGWGPDKGQEFCGVVCGGVRLYRCIVKSWRCRNKSFGGCDCQFKHVYRQRNE